MESMHVLADRTVATLLAGSLALSARPDAPVLPPETSLPTRLRRVGVVGGRRLVERARQTRPSRGVGPHLPVGS